MNDWTRRRVLDAVADAGRDLVALTSAIPDGGWNDPGLGEWTVRQLVGHSGRAFTTAQEYLVDLAPPEVARAGGRGPEVIEALGGRESLAGGFSLFG